MTAEQRIIALDIGGVCINLHFEKMLKKLGIIASVFTPPREFSDISWQFEKGLVSRGEWLDVFVKYTKNKFTRPELISIWNLAIGEAKEGMLEAVREKIAHGFRFVYFSNTSSLHMDAFFSNNAFSHLVTGGVYSYETHLMKPDDAMYEAFEKRYGIPYAYFDDRLENVEGAKKRNWNAIHFRSANDLKNLPV